ncbi:hypothetical protein NQ314_009436, partial [Rhamnusium bicolor]
IGGEGKIVEIDEAKRGKRKYNKGRYLEGQWVFGGIERRSRKFFLVAVEDRSAGTLVDIIKNKIAPGTTIYSDCCDCWRAYDSLGENQYKHLTVNHSVNSVDPDTGTHTQNIERLWVEVRKLVPRFGKYLTARTYLNVTQETSDLSECDTSKRKRCPRRLSTEEDVEDSELLPNNVLPEFPTFNHKELTKKPVTGPQWKSNSFERFESTPKMIKPSVQEKPISLIPPIERMPKTTTGIHFIYLEYSRDSAIITNMFRGTENEAEKMLKEYLRRAKEELSKEERKIDYLVHNIGQNLDAYGCPLGHPRMSFFKKGYIST